MVPWELIFAIVPGIILFLYGIEQFSREVQIAAGEYLRNLIRVLTKMPVQGTEVGALVTALVKSSTATTVITNTEDCPAAGKGGNRMRGGAQHQMQQSRPGSVRHGYPCASPAGG
jgi:hypothetical protein